MSLRQRDPWSVRASGGFSWIRSRIFRPRVNQLREIVMERELLRKSDVLRQPVMRAGARPIGAVDIDADTTRRRA